MKTKDLAYMALFTALIAAGAFIKIPIPLCPFTLQFLFTTLAGLLLGVKRGTLCVVCYIVLGLIGLPIFTNGGGIFYVLEPTFGYIIGFALGAFVTGAIAWRVKNPSFVRSLIAAAAGLGVVYVCGMVYYYLICNLYAGVEIGLKALFLYCFLLAVPGDIFLCFVSAIAAKRLFAIINGGGVQKKTDIKALKEKALSGAGISRKEAESLVFADLTELCAAADEIRSKRCGNGFDLCSIVNAKCGKCGEDCKFCAQSAHYRTDIGEHPLLGSDEMLAAAKFNASVGALRFSAVTSGGKLGESEVDDLCKSLERIKREVGIELCVSVGLVDKESFIKLKNSGVTRVHCNLETSRGYFPKVCTTHSYDDKIKVLELAREVGLNVCSGGIMGLGESWSERIDLAFELKDLGVKSVPVNFLTPIPGTPYEHNAPLSDDDKRRVVAIFRFILPDASIRLAGGRTGLADRGKACFASGANAAITGDMLTTSGVAANEDLKILGELGYEVKLND